MAPKETKRDRFPQNAIGDRFGWRGKLGPLRLTQPPTNGVIERFIPTRTLDLVFVHPSILRNRQLDDTGKLPKLVVGNQRGNLPATPEILVQLAEIDLFFVSACLGALHDALGVPLELRPLGQIRNRAGPSAELGK